MMECRLGRRFRLAVNKSTIKLNVRILGFHFYSILSMHPRMKTIGVSNLLLDGKMVTFLDYDSVFLYRVRKEVRMLQRRWDIGSCAIISTGEDIDEQGKAYGNYHVIGLGKLNYQELFDMLEETSVDRNFRRVPEYFNGRYHVLRIAPKFNENWEEVRDRPYLREVLLSETKRECSRAMYDFLRKYYGFPELVGRFKPRFDNFAVLRLVEYTTTHGGWCGELKRLLNLLDIRKLWRQEDGENKSS